MAHADASGVPQRFAHASIRLGGVAMSLLVRPDTFDQNIVHEVAHTYRVEELARLYARKPRVTIVDVGAHIGTFSVLMATLLPRAVVHAFEPAPDNFAVLQANIRHAGLEDRVYATQAAVGSRRGFFATAEIARSPDLQNTGGHAVLGVPIHDAPPVDGRAYAAVVSLAELLDREPRVDVLKIDCEGSEFEILYSLSGEQLSRIDRMLGEIHSCQGFARSATNGLAWNAATLTAYLGRSFDVVATSHRVETDTAILETFHARRRSAAGRALRMLHRLFARVRRPVSPAAFGG